MTPHGDVKKVDDVEGNPLASAVYHAMDHLKEELEEKGFDPEKLGILTFVLTDATAGDTEACIMESMPDEAPEMLPLMIALDGTSALADGMGVKLNIIPMAGMSKGQG